MDLSWDVAPPTFEVIVSAIACGRRLQAAIDDALGSQALTWGLFHALVEIAEARGPIHGGALARRMGVSRQTAHSCIQRLERRGLLRTRTEPWVRSVWLTPDGQIVLDAAWRALDATWHAIERISVDDRRRVVSAEAAIRRELRRPRGSVGWYEDWLTRPQLWDAMG